MNRSPVSSRILASVGYEPVAKVLEIQLKSGSIFQYFDVPDTVYEAFMAADSKGKFFYSEIETAYRSKQVQDTSRFTRTVSRLKRRFMSIEAHLRPTRIKS
jgi:hypothetical protein